MSGLARGISHSSEDGWGVPWTRKPPSIACLTLAPTAYRHMSAEQILSYPHPCRRRGLQNEATAQCALSQIVDDHGASPGRSATAHAPVRSFPTSATALVDL